MPVPPRLRHPRRLSRNPDTRPLALPVEGTVGLLPPVAPACSPIAKYAHQKCCLMALTAHHCDLGAVCTSDLRHAGHPWWRQSPASPLDPVAPALSALQVDTLPEALAAPASPWLLQVLHASLNPRKSRGPNHCEEVGANKRMMLRTTAFGARVMYAMISRKRLLGAPSCYLPVYTTNPVKTHLQMHCSK